MNQLLSYLLQMILVSGLLYGYYHLSLRNQRFHAYNRYYLLSAVIVSIIIPLLNIPVYFQSDPVMNGWAINLQEFQSPDILSKSYVEATATGGRSFFEIIIYAAYFLIAIVFAIRLIISLLYIRKLTRRFSSEKIENIRFVNTNEPGTPFSFFNWMFWDQRIDPFSTQGKQVFRHEVYHIHQRHSWDIMFMELITLASWFNPFFHLYKKELKAIHEFLADEYAMKESSSTSYAELILVHVLKTRNRIVNPFFHNQIKRRIQMILNDQTPARSYLRKLFVIPMLFLSLVLFAFNYKTLSHQSKPPVNSIEKIVESKVSVAKDTSKPRVIALPDTLLVVIDETQRHIITNDKWNAINEIITPGQIQSMNVLKGEAAVKKYGKEWINGVIEITTKKTSLTPINDKEVITVVGHPMNGEKDTLKSGHKSIADSFIVVTGYKKEKDEVEVENKIFSRVEMEAGFPGGNEAFKRFLEDNLNRKTGQNNGAPAGNYTVVIQFIVNLDGTISDIRPLTNVGFGMEQEAIKVLKAGPKWIPAVQNGKNVVAYRKQVINFF